ncbi:LysM peptidoglycan-binding domain-containing protein [Lacticaseibacillus saniviri]|uniref:LysM peptidoglycan-binding domain-containing protein n=1 Tax=Lacticaseibacillus saniviri TaxID=931533 RepID=UPI0006D12F11|nr:LysM domain-containing protein [Lacticaseibacillus saniviri]
MLALVPSFGFVSASQVNAVASSDYTVQAGDNLWNISRQHGISLTTLTKANNIDLNNYVILPGDLLHVPASNITITVGDNPIADAAKKVAAQKAQEAAAQQAAAKAQQEAQQKAAAAAQAQQQAAAKAQQEAQQKAAAAKAQQAQQTQTAATSGSDLKSYVLNKMVAATGQSAATWDYIITRESRCNQMPKTQVVRLMVYSKASGSTVVMTSTSKSLMPFVYTTLMACVLGHSNQSQMKSVRQTLLGFGPRFFIYPGQCGDEAMHCAPLWLKPPPSSSTSCYSADPRGPTSNRQTR